MVRSDIDKNTYILVQKENINNPEGGKIIKPGENNNILSPLDRGFLYGDGVFETLRCYNGKPAFLEKHLKRLNHTTKKLSIYDTFRKKDIEKRINRITSKIEGDVYIRISITRGEQSGLLNPTENSPTLVIIGKKLKKRNYKPAKVETVDIKRPEGFIGRNKTHNYLPNILAKSKTNLDEAIMLDKNNNIASGSTSNIFLIENNILKTPKNQIRKGVIREAVLEIAEKQNIKTKISNISSINDTRSGFLTNSIWGVRPIKRINKIELDTKNKKIKNISRNLIKKVTENKNHN